MIVTKQNYTIRVGKKEVLYFLIYLILIKPAAVTNAGLINEVWNGLQFIVYIYGTYIFVSKRKNVFIWLLTTIFFLFILSAIINNGDVLGVIRKLGPYYFCALFTDNWIKTDGIKPIYSLHFLLVSYSIINFITIVIYPSGLYRSITTDGISTVACWFLGYKNPQIRTLLIALVLDYLLYFSERGKRLGWHTILFTIVVLYSTIFVRSGTALLALFLFLLLLFLLHKDNNILVRLLSPNGIIVSYLVLNVLIVLLQATFLPFIEKYVSSWEFIQSDIGTMSSRTYVWQAALLILRNKWLLGNGGLSFSATLYNFRVSHPHNYLLYQWLSGGVLAVVLTLLLYRFCLSTLFKGKNTFDNRMLICAVCSILLMGLVESLTEFPLLYAFLVLCNNIDCIKKR